MVIRDDKLLLSKLHGVMHLPGGGLEAGELPEAAVIRETREETGVTVDGPCLLDIVSTFFTFSSDFETGELIHNQSLLIYYHCDFVTGELSTAGFDAYEKVYGKRAEWMPIEKLDDIMAGGNDDWRAVVKKVLKRS